MLLVHASLVDRIKTTAKSIRSQSTKVKFDLLR